MPAPGFQKPMPYFFAADARSCTPPCFHPWHGAGLSREPIRLESKWSQWIVLAHSALSLAGLHKLRHGHLRRGILHRHTVRTERQHAPCHAPNLRHRSVGMRHRIFSANVDGRPNFFLAFSKTSAFWRRASSRARVTLRSPYKRAWYLKPGARSCAPRPRPVTSLRLGRHVPPLAERRNLPQLFQRWRSMSLFQRRHFPRLLQRADTSRDYFSGGTSRRLGPHSLPGNRTAGSSGCPARF